MKNSWTAILFVVLGAAIAFGTMLLMQQDQEVKYARMGEVFDRYELKQTYEQKLKDFESEAEENLKGMKDELDRSEIEGNASKTARLRMALERKQEELSQEYNKRSEEFQKVIWDEINGKIEKLGKSKGYTYILGANGNGSIMYANEGEDITEEIIDYLNEDA